MTIAIILGTRPEIIKMAPVIRECQKRGLDYSVIHAGQHYSYQMDRIFFQQLELPPRQDNLDLVSGPHGEQTGKIMAGRPGESADGRAPGCGTRTRGH